jgi:hypothetical protein
VAALRASGGYRREFHASRRTPTSDSTSSGPWRRPSKGEPLIVRSVHRLIAPPDFVIEEVARGVGAREYPPSRVHGRPSRRRVRMGAAALRSHRSRPGDRRRVCRHQRVRRARSRATCTYAAPNATPCSIPQISYPTYAMGATLAGLRAVPVVAGRTDSLTSHRSIHVTPRARSSCGRTLRPIRAGFSTTSRE